MPRVGTSHIMIGVRFALRGPPMHSRARLNGQTRFRRSRASLKGAAALCAVLACLPVGDARGQTTHAGDYAIDGVRCGEGALAFPRLKIGMRQGTCAGLVASAADGLIFPRSIVQIPGRDEFVIVDLG